MNTLKLSVLAMTVMITSNLAADLDGKNTAEQTNQNTGLIIRQDGRQEGDISLDGEWDFTFTPRTVKEIPDFPPDTAFDCKVKIPGYWDDQWDNFKNAKWWNKAPMRTAYYGVKYINGIGWSRKTIDVPAEWRGRTITLTVAGGGRAPGVAYVWLNHCLVGRYDHGVYTPYSFDLTGHLKFGEKNELVIALDNSSRGFTSGWGAGFYGKAGGIAGSVSLHVSEGAGRIFDLYVRAGSDLQEVVWDADLDVPNGAAPESMILWEVSKKK